jgi:hypothetical protein
MKKLIYFLFVAFFAISMVSCNFGTRDAVLVCVNEPEILSYIETFNAIQDKFKLEVAYSSVPQDALSDKKIDPDLVIGERLGSPASMRKLEPLGKLLMRKWIRNDLFYTQSLKSCEYENEMKLLPLSFSLSAVVFKKGSIKGLVSNDKIITLDELKKISVTQNEIRGDRFKRMGFAPVWNKEFLYDIAELFHSDFSWNSSTVLSWNNEAFGKGCEFLASWYREMPGKPGMMDDFFSSYINKPYYQLVSKGDIFCYLTDSRSYYKIPEDKRASLEIRWLSNESKISVNDDVIYIGISKNAKQKEGASIFIRWLFLPETQMKLLEINHFKRLDETFGIAGGFSSLREITENFIPQHYPIFAGFIPPPDSLMFPHILPEKWKSFKSEVLFPWMTERMMVSGTSSKLDDELHFFK